MSEPEETHVMLIADSISSSVHGANSPLKLGSNIFEQGSAELNLKLQVLSISDHTKFFGWNHMVWNLCKEEDKIWTNENMELNSNTVDAVLINGRQARPDNLIPYQTFDLTTVKNFRFSWATIHTL